MPRPKSSLSPRQKKQYSNGTERLLWETEGEYSLYLLYTRLPETTGLVERTIESVPSEGWEKSELESIAAKNDWVGRSASYDKFWFPKAAKTTEKRIENAEILGSEVAELAARLVMSRLQQEPHRIKTSELIAIVKLAPVINRSESTSTVIKGD